MIDDTQSESDSRRMRTLALMALAGLVAGFPVGWLMGKLGKAAGVLTLPWADEVALTLAATFVVAGVAVVALSTSRRGQALLANPGAPDYAAAIHPPQIAFFRLQAGVLLLAGLLLGAPVIAGAISHHAPLANGAPLMAAIVAGFVLQSLFNVMLWRRADEVYRQVMAETGAVCFWGLQGALFLWASGVKLHVLPEISSWDAIVVLMGVYLLASTVLGYRRGLA
jgi:hypothetical protein